MLEKPDIDNAMEALNAARDYSIIKIARLVKHLPKSFRTFTGLNCVNK